MIWAFIDKFYQIIIATLLAIVLILSGIAIYQYIKIQSLQNKELKTEVKQYEAQADQVKKSNEVSAEYEQVKAEQQVKTEYIIKEVEKIIHRPVYRNMCLDDDGVRLLNSQILEADSSSESEAALLDFADTR